MKKLMQLSLGQSLLVVYGLLIIIFVLKTHSSVAGGLTWVTYPIWWLLKDVQSVPTFFVQACGYTCTMIIFAVVQGLVLYYGGNWLGKVLKKK